jgi:hypothetical protein
LGNWTKVATPSASVRSILVARTCYRFKTKMPSQLNKAPTGVKLALGVGFSLHLLTTAFGPSRLAPFFGPTVANGALRTWLDLQLAPPSRDCKADVLNDSCQRIDRALLVRPIHACRHLRSTVTLKLPI